MSHDIHATIGHYAFTNQTAVITGGGRGFGFEVAHALAMNGANVVIGELNEELGHEVAKKLADDGVNARFVPTDVRDPRQVDSLAAAAVNEFGPIDLWLNNAGIALHGPSESLAVESWRKSIDIMLSGTFWGCQAASRSMLEQGSGTIVNMASVNGLLAQAGRAAYCAAKAGVIRLTEVLASEWGPRGVRVNAIAPAVFMTELAQQSLNDGSASLDVYLERSPLGRLGELSELVNTVLFAFSDKATHLNGNTLRVDGGWLSDHYL